MRRILPALLVVPLAACGVSRSEFDALALRVDSVHTQVVELTAWARKGMPNEAKSVNLMLAELAEIEKTYNDICVWAKAQTPPIVGANKSCPGDTEPTDPPSDKPPAFPPE